MQPLTEQVEESKNQAIEDFLNTLGKMNISVLGQNDELGLISFEKSNNLYYAHFIEMQDDNVKVSIMPGFSYLKDQAAESVKTDIIKEIMNKIGNRDK